MDHLANSKSDKLCLDVWAHKNNSQSEVDSDQKTKSVLCFSSGTSWSKLHERTTTYLTATSALRALLYNMYVMSPCWTGFFLGMCHLITSPLTVQVCCRNDEDDCCDTGQSTYINVMWPFSGFFTVLTFFPCASEMGNLTN